MMTDSENKSNAMPSRKAVRRSWIPDDIVTEVLLRLPIKSVLRFRAVCRSWAALLSSEDFRGLHRAITRAAAPPKLLHFSPTAGFEATAAYSRSLSSSRPIDDKGDEPELLFTLDYARGNGVEVLTPASCHGLTLVYDALAKAYYICNAATRAVARLPPSPDVSRAYKISTGLGFDAQTREHKVVRLIDEQVTLRCEVYTPGGSSHGDGDRWRPAAGGLPLGRLRSAVISALYLYDAPYSKLSPVFATGFLHWFNIKLPRAAIVYFSVTEETFGSLGSPPFPPHHRRASREPAVPHLVEMDNQLCLVRDLRDDTPYASSSLEIWRLLDYSSGGDWSLDHRIDLSARRVLGRELREPQAVTVIGSIDDGNKSAGKKTIVITTCKHQEEVPDKFRKRVYTYDLSTQAVNMILSVTETSKSTGFSLFEDCLAPVHKTDEEIALSSTTAKAVQEILFRLPAKSVIQSKLICRQWLRLIKSESFIQSYFEHKKNMGDKIRRPMLMLVGKGTGQSAPFSFAPLDAAWLPEAAASHHCTSTTLLDEKVVCSKPCHGMNLVSTERDDYLYNPGTGFHRAYRKLNGYRKGGPLPLQRRHAFALSSRNVGLTFDPLSHEHASVEIIYHHKDLESREYRSFCTLQWCSKWSWLPLPPPLPVNDMPPANVGGVLYWMSDPRLGKKHERAILSFDIATELFGTIPCPECIAVWSSTSPCRAFVVELQGALCAVLSDPVANSLDVWRLDRGGWGRACMIHLESSPDYSLVTNVVVVPLAVDPEHGRILLNTGRRLGLYDPAKQTIQDLYSLPLVASARHLGGCQGNNDPIFSQDQSVGEISRLDGEITPLVPMLYEESLACYLPVGGARRPYAVNLY